MINAFGRYRLLTFDRDPVTRGPTIEVAHEALLREWRRLRGWLDESRSDVRLQRLLASAAEEWLGADRDSGYLLRASRLDQFEGWATNTNVALTQDERAYLEASLAARQERQAAEEVRLQRELALERAAVRRLRVIAGVLIVASVIGITLTLAVFRQSQAARAEANLRATAQAQTEIERAEAQNVALVAGSQAALANNNTDAALALAWQAITLNPDSAIAQAQLSEAAYTPGTVRRFVGHTGPVNTVAISPDGQTALSSSVDSTLILWDLATGEILQQLEGHTSGVRDVVFSPDGHMAASVSDEMAILWEMPTGQIIRQFKGHEGPITEIAFSPDGQSIVTADGQGLVTNIISDESILIQWDIETGEIMRRFESNTRGIRGLEFTPDGSAILYGSADDGAMRLMDIQTGQIIHEMSADLGTAGGLLIDVAISPDGLTAISGFSNFGILLWDLSTGALLHRHALDSGAFGIAFHPTNGTVLIGSRIGTMIVLDPQAGEILQTFAGHDENVWDVEISPNGRYALSASIDNTLRLWDLDRGSVIRHIAEPNSLAWSVDLSPDGHTALAASTDGTATLWDVETGEVIRQYTDDQPVMTVKYSPDGKTALISTGYEFSDKIEPGHLVLWDVETGEVIRQFIGHPYIVNSVDFSPDGKRAVSAGSGAVVILWDVETGQEIRRFDDYFVDSPWSLESFWDVEFSPDGRTILASYGKGPLMQWDVETGEEIKQLVGHFDLGGAIGIKFTADGRRAVTGGWDGQAILWDMQTGDIIRRFTNHVGSLGAVEFTPDERLMLGGSGDGTSSLWNVETGEEIRRYGNGFVIQPVFSSDGRQALAGFHDGAVELWRIDSTLDELLQWTEANRYIPEPTCEQRELYRLEPLCESE